jgi:hypothetical protein
LAGALLWLVWAGWHVRRFRRLLRFATLAPASLQEEAQALARRLGLRRCPAVWLLPGAVSPMVWALGRSPRILFPAGLLGCLDGEQRASLLLHELAHVRRRDHWVRMVELLAFALYWWHPVAWWARRELREAEEQCCDAWVVWALGGAPRIYALALVQAVAFFSQARSPLPLTASGIGQVRHLRRRLTMIMRGTTPRSLSRAGLLTVFAAGLLLLPALPSGAQDAPGNRTPAAGGSREAREREIQVLRDRLRRLELQERGALPVDPVLNERNFDLNNRPKTPPDLFRDPKTGALYPKDLSRVQDEVKVLRAQMEQKQRELDALTARYRAAMRRLAEIQGGGDVRRTPDPDTRTDRNRIEVKPVPVPRNTDRRNDLTPVPVRPDPRAKEHRPLNERDRAADLDRRLERLLREVEELRREMRRLRPDDAGPRKQ